VESSKVLLLMRKFRYNTPAQNPIHKFIFSTMNMNTTSENLGEMKGPNTMNISSGLKPIFRMIFLILLVKMSSCSKYTDKPTKDFYITNDIEAYMRDSLWSVLDNLVYQQDWFDREAGYTELYNQVPAMIVEQIRSYLDSITKYGWQWFHVQFEPGKSVVPGEPNHLKQTAQKMANGLTDAGVNNENEWRLSKDVASIEIYNSLETKLKKDLDGYFEARYGWTPDSKSMPIDPATLQQMRDSIRTSIEENIETTSNNMTPISKTMLTPKKELTNLLNTNGPNHPFNPQHQNNIAASHNRDHHKGNNYNTGRNNGAGAFANRKFKE